MHKSKSESISWWSMTSDMTQNKKLHVLYGHEIKLFKKVDMKLQKKLFVYMNIKLKMSIFVRPYMKYSIRWRRLHLYTEV